MHVPGSICKGEHRVIDTVPYLLALQKKFTLETNSFKIPSKELFCNTFLFQ